MKKQPDSDHQLLVQIQADNMLAFDELYRLYQKRVFLFALNILKSKEEAENIVHEVFIKLWEYRNTIHNVKPYLFSIAYNTTISLIRKKTKEQEFIHYLKSLPESMENSVSIELEYKEMAEKTEAIINKLPDRQREVYLLSRQEGLSYKEIAEHLHISVNTVENHIARALRMIRNELDSFSLIAVLFFYLFI